jgi:hypothetical protein
MDLFLLDRELLSVVVGPKSHVDFKTIINDCSYSLDIFEFCRYPGVTCAREDTSSDQTVGFCLPRVSCIWVLLNPWHGLILGTDISQRYRWLQEVSDELPVMWEMDFFFPVTSLLALSQSLGRHICQEHICVCIPKLWRSFVDCENCPPTSQKS